MGEVRRRAHPGRLAWADIQRQKQGPELTLSGPQCLSSVAFWSSCSGLEGTEKDLSISARGELREVSLSTYHFSGTGFSLRELGGSWEGAEEGPEDTVKLHYVG